MFNVSPLGAVINKDSVWPLMSSGSSPSSKEKPALTKGCKAFIALFVLVSHLPFSSLYLLSGLPPPRSPLKSGTIMLFASKFNWVSKSKSSTTGFTLATRLLGTYAFISFIFSFKAS